MMSSPALLPILQRERKKASHVQVGHVQRAEVESAKCFNQRISAHVKRRSQLVVRLKAIKC